MAKKKEIRPRRVLVEGSEEAEAAKAGKKTESNTSIVVEISLHQPPVRPERHRPAVVNNSTNSSSSSHSRRRLNADSVEVE